MGKKYIYIVLAFIAAIAISIIIGKSIGEKKQADKQTKIEIRYIQADTKQLEKKIDSLNKTVEKISKNTVKLKEKEIEIRTEYEKITIEKPANVECEHLYNNCTHKIALMEKTISMKDSIEVNLNEQLVLKDKIIDNKDNIISNKDKEIELVKKLNKPRNKKFGIGIQVGTGVSGFKSTIDQSYSAKFTPVYVGVGLSYNIFTF